MQDQSEKRTRAEHHLRETKTRLDTAEDELQRLRHDNHGAADCQMA